MPTQKPLPSREFLVYEIGGRIWSMKDFSKNKIKDYKYWEVYVAENQSYLGRCVVWCKREEAEDLTDVTEEEWEELIIILRELKEAITKAFGPGWFNYSFLGNDLRHLHAHFIPRYSSKKEFAGTTFEDKLWGNNFKTDNDFITPDDVREKIRLEILKALK